MHHMTTAAFNKILDNVEADHMMRDLEQGIDVLANV